jgi:myo-inositol-hexaphosphate 3-phosphohydrolase
MRCPVVTHRRDLDTGLMRLRVCGVLVGVVGALASLPATAAPAADPVVRVSSTAETTPVTHSRDAADDPAIWVDPAHPGRSLVIGNDKQGALEIYNLSGGLVQRITTDTTFWGNVDVRQSVTVGGSTYDIVAAMNRGLRLYSVDPATRELASLTAGGAALVTGGGEGLCLYHPEASGRLFAFVVARTGRVREFRISDRDNDGSLRATQVRQFALGSESEGCVADDRLGRVYLSQEDVGLWRMNAELDVPAHRELIDRVGRRGHLVRDVEGVTLVTSGGKGHLIVSAQNGAHPKKSYFVVYSRRGNVYQFSFRIVRGPSSDGCERTDGVAAYAGPLGRRYPQGIFVCQDDKNTAPGVGYQDFKFTRLDSTGLAR